MRGRIEARDSETGDLIWTFNTIPGPGEVGNETWGGNSWETGGGATWATGTYDVAQNTLIWGIGNPQPDWDPTQRPGDNLFTNSAPELLSNTGSDSLGSNQTGLSTRNEFLLFRIIAVVTESTIIQIARKLSRFA